MEQRYIHQMSSSPEASDMKRHGCLFYGCLTSIVLILLISLALYLSAKWVTQKVVYRFTSENQLVLSTSDLDSTQTALVIKRYDDFKSAFESGKEGALLLLNSDELNSLIAKHPDFEKIKDNVSIDLVSNNINVKINFPLDRYGYKGRFLTGEAMGSLERPGGVLFVELKRLKLGDTEVPDSYLPGQKNLLSKVYEDPDKAKFLARFKTIEIVNGLLRLGT